MKLRLCYFAALREALGVAEEVLNVPQSVRTAAQLRVYLQTRGSLWAEALGSARPLGIAINQKLAAPADLLSEGAEVAFFPPVTGG